jgi:hypothetical protein
MSRTVILVALLFLPPAAHAGDNADATTREVRAIRLTAPVTIDGLLSESVWQQAEGVDWFRQADPIEGAAASLRTDVRVAYDDEAIYVGARMFDTAPDSITAVLARRDVSVTADRLCIYLDPYLDRRSGYYFMVTAAGQLLDGTLFNDNWDDSSWDAVWEGRARRDDKGWTAEMRIPYSQLRFRKAARHRWGINFKRVIPRRSESNYLAYRPKKESGFVSRFPVLVGIENVNPGRSIEVLPYVTSRAEYLDSRSNDFIVRPLPPIDRSRYLPDGGADLRMPLGSQLTLNATVNPDFGQVEVDPAVVNLSDYESFFQEKRPFFVENASVFRCGNEGADDYWNFNWPEPAFFYSRRIGRPPQGSLPSAETADVPRATTILGAAKVTGKIGPGWNFGTLHVLTGKEQAELEGGGARWKSEVEPLTYYGVVRSLKEFGGRRQGLGFMTNFVDRSFTGDRLRAELNRSTLATAVDGWRFLDRNQTWVLSGWSAASNVRGTAGRIAALQQDPRHYFQRPDAGHVSVDPAATSLSGWGTRLWLNKQKGNTFGNFALGAISPGFDNNDLGFLQRADVVNGHAGYGYRWTQPNAWRKYEFLLGSLFSSWDFGGNRTVTGFFAKHYAQFANDWELETYADVVAASLNNRLTRGGPLTISRPGYEVGAVFASDPKRPLVYSFEGYGSGQPGADSQDWSVRPGVEWKPVPSVTVRVGPGYERVRQNAHYIATIADPAATATYGNRYVFGELDQTTVSAEIRLNWAFTPNVSLQFYGQPLVSTGRYSNLKELARPRSYDFIGPGAGSWTYDASSGVFDPGGAGEPGAYDPDFNFKSLRGNAVFRWEYMPGSAFYLVWTQERTDGDASDGFGLGPSFKRLTQTRADNIFLAKVTCYLNL